MKTIVYSFLAVLIFSCAEPTREITNYSIEDFYENTRVSGGIFSPDETKLLVSSDQSGIFNVYDIDIATG